MYTKYDLKMRQSWPLDIKIAHAERVIQEFAWTFGKHIYVAFSGGLDSTVLLHLVRKLYPETDAVFCDTGLEYPEIRKFVETMPNVTWLKPIKYDHEKKKYVPTNFREVIDTYGYPVISKEVAQAIEEARKPEKYSYSKSKFETDSDYYKKYGERFSLARWSFLKDSDIPISAKCCDVMKKTPFKLYSKTTGKFGFVGTRAEESRLRTNQWYKQGCNSYEGRRGGISKPLSIWTHQDILAYIVENKLPYCQEIYGDIVLAGGKYKTLKAQNTGCMFCMFGVHLEKAPNRFQRMAVSHPELYDYCINKLGCGKVLEFVGVDYTPIIYKKT